MVLSRLRTLFKEWKQNHNDGKELCNINKELAEEYASIFNLEKPEDIFKLRDALLNDKVFIDRLKKEVGYSLGRRSFLEALFAGTGVALGLAGASSVADAKTVIGGKGITVDDLYVFPQVIPASAIVYKEDSKVIVRDMFGKIIASGTVGVDDASVIQSAIDKVATKGGGVVKICAGKYLIDQSINITKDNIYLFGEAWKTVLDGSGSGTILRVSGSFSPWNEIENFKINGFTFQNANIGVEFIMSDRLSITSNQFINVKNAIHLQRVLVATVRNNQIKNCGDSTTNVPVVLLDTNGLDNGNTEILIEHNVFENNQFVVIDVKDYFGSLKIHKNHFEANTGESNIYIEPSYSSFYLTISENRFQQNTGENLNYHINFGDTVSVNGMNIYANYFQHDGIINVIRYASSYGERTVVTENVFVGGSTGYVVIGYKIQVFANNWLKNGTSHGISVRNNPIVANNIIIVPDGCIGIDADFSDFGIIVGNYIVANTKAIRVNRFYAGYFIIMSNTINGTGVIDVYSGSALVKYNKGYPTDSFLYTGLSVAVGGGAYGSPTTITSLSGIITSFDAILHVTAGAGEVITVKFECVWDDGTTTYVTKSLDNSAGTATVSQDFEITVADKISLWKHGSSLRKINVYAMSSLATPTADAAVTVDIAGSG